MTPDYQYSNYILDCGHTQRIKKQHFKAGKYSCKTCQELKFKAEALQNNLEFICNSDSSYKRYKFKACGHEKNILPEQVRTGKFKCKVCEENQLISDLSFCGVELVEKKKSKVVLKYSSCGHTVETKYQHIGNRNVPSCKDCRLEELKQQSFCEGLELLYKDESNLSTNAYFYKLPCGCTRSLRVGNVKRGAWACTTHSNWWNKPSNIYLIRFSADGFSWLKLGVTTSVERRIFDYKMKKDTNKTVLFCEQVSTYSKAIEMEKYLHKQFKSCNLNHKEMRSYMTNGFTECYPHDIMQKMLSKIEEVVKNE